MTIATAVPQAQAQPQPTPSEYLVGLDLGQAQDYTALAAVERTLRDRPTPTKRPPQEAHYAVRYLKRWHLGTRYTDIALDVAALLLREPLPGCRLVVDATGVGRAVVDVLREALKKHQVRASLEPVVITAGHRAHLAPGGTWNVPKKDLVSALQALLQAQRFKVADLPERELLVKELMAFKVKVTASATETFESWRERDHDDLVLAVALACWSGERPRKVFQIWTGPEPAAPVPPARPGTQQTHDEATQRYLEAAQPRRALSTSEQAALARQAARLITPPPK
jgi:hypothetical protein